MNELSITDGAMVMDGGSTGLRGFDETGSEVDLLLDWSIGSCRAGTPQLSMNGAPVPRRSTEEARCLALLRNARIIRVEASAPAGDVVSPSCLALGDDIADYFGAIAVGPDDALAWLVRRLVFLVSSAAYWAMAWSRSS